MNRSKMQQLGQLAIQNNVRNAGIRQEAKDRTIAMVKKRVATSVEQHVIHTPVQPTNRLTALIRKSVVTIENLIQFVKGLFK